MSTRITFPTALLPQPSGLRLEHVEIQERMLLLTLCTTRAAAACPTCAAPSYHIHSHYQRTVADLPWGGSAVRLFLQVRKFFCRAPACPQRIFTERLPQVVAPYARKTVRLNDMLQLIGVALGGAAGARLAVRVGMTVSPTTLIRRIIAAARPVQVPPQALGIDEWAWRRGSRYGTILVDLDQHHVVDLLPDRAADTVAAWLRAHPSVEIVSRDRSGLYADAVARGAPQAICVADRFHLMKNLREALEKFLLQKGTCLKEAAALTASALAAPNTVPLSLDEMYRGRRKSPQNWQQRAEAESLRRHAQRMASYEAICALHTKGAEIAEIARTVGVSRRTVYRYLRLGGPPERKRPSSGRRRRVLEPYEPYLLQRWNEGCHTGMQLWREIRALGFTYSATNVARFVAQLRREGHAGRPLGRCSSLTHGRGPSAREVALLFLQRPSNRSDEQTIYLEQVCQQDAAIATACRLTRDFADMVRERKGEQLDAWIAAAAHSGIADLRRFALGLRGDQAAVAAGLTLEWSNGPTEGHIHRLKLLKRQMYGRAGFELLRQRVLQAA
jgi:transposase